MRASAAQKRTIAKIASKITVFIVFAPKCFEN
jgi:hypothetical protein